MSAPDIVEQAFAEGRAQGIADLAARLQKRFEWMRADMTRIAQRHEAIAEIYAAEMREIDRCAREESSSPTPEPGSR